MCRKMSIPERAENHRFTSEERGESRSAEQIWEGRNMDRGRSVDFSLFKELVQSIQTTKRQKMNHFSGQKS